VVNELVSVSVRPSEKYLKSGSEVMFANGKTTSELAALLVIGR